MINIALSTDQRGFAINATLIASILRRASRPVHVRCWCRGFLAESFETGPLKVEFLAASGEAPGKYPLLSGPAAYDRLLVIRDCPDWDRCMVMDYDQLVLCDLAPLFDLDLGDHLLAAHMQGPGVDMAYAMRVWLKRPLPAGWEHVAGHPYFLMPPLMNLRAMREAGTWDRFVEAHAAFGADEQLSLTAATGGRTLPLERKWNLFPKLHIRDGEVPAGVVHWSGWPKPWHKGANVWRPDIWESERASWEHLRMGIWKKPLVVEVEPEDPREVNALLRRGCEVVVVTEPGPDTRDIETGTVPAAENGSLGKGPQEIHPEWELFPDLGVIHGRTEFHAFLAAHRERIASVRFGQWCEPDEWLQGSPTIPLHLTLKGARSATELDHVRSWGFSEEARYLAEQWPHGGPLPAALRYFPADFGTGMSGGETIVLRGDCKFHGNGGLLCGPRPQPAPVPGAAKVGVAVFATGTRRRLLRNWLRSVQRNFLSGMLERIFIFTDGEIVAEDMTGVIRIPVPWQPWRDQSLSQYAKLIQEDQAGRFEGLTHFFLLSADLRVVDPVGAEVLGDGLSAVLHAGYHDQAREKFTYEARESSAACVRRHEGVHYFAGAVQGGAREEFFMAAEAMTQAIGRDRKAGISAIWHAESHWNRVLVDRPPTVVLSPAYGRPEGQATGFAAKILMSREGAEMEDAPSPPRHARRHGCAGVDCRDGTDADSSEDARLADTLARITGWVRVISLPERDDRRRELCANWEPFGLRWQWLDGTRPQPDEIRWQEMRDMEAYGWKDGWRGEYVIGAVGCKRAGVMALRKFLESGEETGLICQDDCRWTAGAGGMVRKALDELPEDWEMLYFSASARAPHVPYSAHLVRLEGARLCTAILWKRQAAERLLPELEVCGCEWDVFMQRCHPSSRAYCVVPMPAFQAKSRSDIVGRVVQPANV